MRSSDLLRSVLWPAAVVLESDEVELLLALSWSKVEDVLSAPFILLLSDLLSEVVVLEELGVELELVSWLCARAPEAASASARADNTMNLIENLRGLLCTRRLAMPDPVHNARPLARRCVGRPS